MVSFINSLVCQFTKTPASVFPCARSTPLLIHISLQLRKATFHNFVKNNSFETTQGIYAFCSIFYKSV